MIVKVFVAVSVVSTLFLASASLQSANAQQPVSAASPYLAACGADGVDFAVKKSKAPSPAPPPPAAGKALVYVIEAMPNYAFVTKKVNIGMDGHWLGATDANTYMRFAADPGVHHLCAVYQGHAVGMDEEGRTLLLRLKLDAGKTYYVRYHALFLKGSPGIAFFEPVDPDEGHFLLQQAVQAISIRKK
jgi:hypothetical protein